MGRKKTKSMSFDEEAIKDLNVGDCIEIEADIGDDEKMKMEACRISKNKTRTRMWDGQEKVMDMTTTIKRKSKKNGKRRK